MKKEMKEFIVPIDDTARNFDEIFIGTVRTYDKLVRCRNCEMNPYNKPAGVDVVHGTPDRCFELASRKNAFCSEGKEEKTK